MVLSSDLKDSEVHLKKRLFILLFWGMAQWAVGQNLLEKHVSYSASNQPLSLVIDDLSEQLGFDYSYNPSLEGMADNMTVRYAHLPLKSVLDDLFKGKPITYQVKGQQLILKERKAPKKPVSASQTIYGNIMVADSTDSPVAGVTVKELNLGISTVSDAKGNFLMVIPNPDYEVKLRFSAPDYLTKSLNFNVKSTKRVVVRLEKEAVPEPISPPQEKDTVVIQTPSPPAEKLEEASAPWEDSLAEAYRDKRIEEEGLLRPVYESKLVQSVLSLDFLRRHTRDDSLFYSRAQLTLLPPTGTNGRESGRSINHLSLNLLGGYSAGVQGLELSGLLAINRFNVLGVQGSGLASLTGGKMHGLSASGLLNTVKLDVQGAQLSGLFNSAGIDLRGVQISGLANNVVASFHGVQITGVYNRASGQGKGLQIAGVCNHIRGNMQGWQLSTLNIVEGNTSGFQIGVFNFSRGKIKGLQFGLINYADDSDGYQIGLININRKAKVPVMLLLLKGG